jgi:hypothetical protein
MRLPSFLTEESRKTRFPTEKLIRYVHLLRQEVWCDTALASTTWQIVVNSDTKEEPSCLVGAHLVLAAACPSVQPSNCRPRGPRSNSLLCGWRDQISCCQSSPPDVSALR